MSPLTIDVPVRPVVPTGRCARVAVWVPVGILAAQGGRLGNYRKRRLGGGNFYVRDKVHFGMDCADLQHGESAARPRRLSWVSQGFSISGIVRPHSRFASLPQPFQIQYCGPVPTARKRASQSVTFAHQHSFNPAQKRLFSVFSGCCPDGEACQLLHKWLSNKCLPRTSPFYSSAAAIPSVV